MHVQKDVAELGIQFDVRGQRLRVERRPVHRDPQENVASGWRITNEIRQKHR